MSQTRHVIIPEASLIVIKDGNILLLRRFQTGYEDGKWALPAGHVEPGETALQCICREAMEELGITVTENDVQCRHVMHRGDNSGRVGFFFVAQKWTGEPTNVEPHKADAMEWFPVDALPEPMVAYMKQAVEMVLKDVVYSEHGWNQ